ncbi:hypothetical protein [Antrihabitans stalactiti]|uniref:Antitoxin VbhA domain-containing protein n=1 Tax=Antrihabitans stalactiti TaxID=2584121 RepID=A0A848KSI8_9NOCA|nr:hypothetical protein [Antrihabitans stalactiti]NMN99482.1 hypothetical protein [Antrihabitans stalactiti]
MPTVKELMQQLAAGELTVEQVCEVMRTKTPRAIPTSREWPDENDARAYDDDSLIHLGHANAMGRITDEEYDRIAAAFGAG